MREEVLLRMVTELAAVSGRKVVFTAAFGVVFGVFDVLGRATVGERVDWSAVGWGWSACLTVVVSLLAWVLLSWVDARGEASSPPPSKRTALRFAVVSALLMLAGWTVFFLHVWPMASMNDTHWAIGDPIGASIQHPLVFNVVVASFSRVSLYLFGTELVGMVLAALFQMCLWAFALGLNVYYFLRLGVSRVVLGVVGAYLTLSPLVADYAVSLIKDSLFSVFVFLLVPVLLQLWRSRGAALGNRWFVALTVVAFVGFATTRNNGLVALLPLVVLCVVFARERRARAALLAGGVVLVSLVPMALTQSLVGPQKFQEAVGSGLQMVAYSVAEDPACLPASAKTYFDQVMPLSDWEKTYSARSVDPIKDSPSFNGQFLTETKGRFMKEWASTAVACPSSYLSAYILHVSPLWRLDGTPLGSFGQSLFWAVVSNYPANKDALVADYAERGISNESLLPKPIGDAYTFVLSQSPSHGFWLWASVLAMVAFQYRRRYEWIPLFAPMILIWGTLFLAAPTVYPFRYIAPIIAIAPLAYALLLGTPKVTRERQRMG